jgi:aminoglycoside phosphotransferase (APT) family kinase protein
MDGWKDVVDIAALSAWMDRCGLGAGPLEDVVVLAGGTQNVLLRFTRADRTYVLRRPPKHLRDNSNDTMRREARMLAALAETDVPHPRLIAACPEEDVLGAAFYLMEPVEGFNATVALPPLHAANPAMRHQMGMSLVDAIAKLGALDYRAVGLGDFGKPDKYLERQVVRWRGQLQTYNQMAGWPGPDAIPGVDKVAAWLDAHRPAQFQPGIIHGDYHLANVMYRPDSPDIAAIVDWELTTIGDPLIDLGWLLATWPDAYTPEDKKGVRPWDGFPTAEELVARYAAASTRDLSHIDWYMVLACYKLGILLEGTHARACAGQAAKETGDMLHEATVSLFERALRKIR